MAGYSGTPLAQKLGIKPGHKVTTSALRPDIGSCWRRCRRGVSFTTEVAAAAPFVHLFATKRQTLEKELKRLRKLIADTGIVWVSWPKNLGRHDRYHGRRYPGRLFAARFRGRKSLRGR